MASSAFAHSRVLLYVGVALAFLVGVGSGEMDPETAKAMLRLERKVDQLQRELDKERSLKTPQHGRGGGGVCCL